MNLKERNIFLGAILILLIIFAVFAVNFAVKRGKNNKDPFEPDPGGNTVIPEDRVMERIEVPGAKCGDGSQYVMFYSEGPERVDGKTNNRVVIWMPGGGSTQMTLEGELSSPILNAATFLDRLAQPGDYYLTEEYMEDRSFIFVDHPDNKGFVDTAHWVIFPYCTQDFHSGNKDEFTEYDFTEVDGVVNDIERAINGNFRTLEQIEERFPNLKIDGHNADGDFKVDELKIDILHMGAKNVELSLDLLFETLKNRGFDVRNSEIVMSGSSAGGFGTWYNAWRVGDILYNYPGTKFTVIPQAGSPTLMRYGSEGDLITLQSQIDSMEQRHSWHEILLPCNVPGAGYDGGDECMDALDLLDHYNNRWDGMDVRFLAVVNKEDLLGVRGLGFENENDPGFQPALLNFCQTVHRYSQYFSLTDNTDVYAGWLYNKQGNGFRRVHGFKKAALTVTMQKPNGQNSGGKTLMKLINEVALREVSGPVQIEYVLGVVQDPKAFESEVIADPGHLPECNVAWPNGNRP